MKLKIDNETLAEEFFEGSRLMGIVAPLKDYKFSWEVNKGLGFNFKLNHSLEIQLVKKKVDYFFSVYEYKVPGCCMIHYLYNNQHKGEYLLPEFKHLDFVWLIKDEEMPEDELKCLHQAIKLIPAVQLVNVMTHEKIKNKQHLIL